MIKTSELRQGNKLLWGAYVQTVDAIGYGDFIQCDPMDRDTLIEEFQPIPLTPELLDKLGFKKMALGDKIKWISEEDDTSIGFICEDNHIKLYVYTDADPFYSTAVGRPIMFLHCLQNLYFALTGEELIIEI